MFIEMYIGVKSKEEAEEIIRKIREIKGSLDYDINCSSCGDQLDTASHSDGRFDDNCPDKI